VDDRWVLHPELWRLTNKSEYLAGALVNFLSARRGVEAHSSLTEL
jgi:hypothetical protein